jgi:hypothetical protein
MIDMQNHLQNQFMHKVEINNFHTAIEAAHWCKTNLIDKKWELDYTKVYAFQNSYVFEFAEEQDFILFSLHWVK